MDREIKTIHILAWHFSKISLRSFSYSLDGKPSFLLTFLVSTTAKIQQPNGRAVLWSKRCNFESQLCHLWCFSFGNIIWTFSIWVSSSLNLDNNNYFPYWYKKNEKYIVKCILVSWHFVNTQPFFGHITSYYIIFKI